MGRVAAKSAHPALVSCPSESKIGLHVYPISFLVTNRHFSQELQDPLSEEHHNLSRELGNVVGMWEEGIKVPRVGGQEEPWEEEGLFWGVQVPPTAGGELSITFLPGGESPEGLPKLPESDHKRIPVSGSRVLLGQGFMGQGGLPLSISQRVMADRCIFLATEGFAEAAEVKHEPID